uniref:Uncharacterized protein n=1 Tax=Rhizophora mucronata TaxID=61149 RepID=A0A2P2NQ17_RHIMU
MPEEVSLGLDFLKEILQAVLFLPLDLGLINWMVLVLPKTCLSYGQNVCKLVL